MSLALDVQHACAGAPPVAALRRWAAAALEGAPGTRELCIRIVAEAESADLNRRYRHRDGPTNVLSFPFQSPGDVHLPLLGDLVICAPVVAREAAAQGKSLEAHWAHMVVHGVLHLLGHDHEDEAGATTMESLETRTLEGLGFPDPYRDE